MSKIKFRETLLASTMIAGMLVATPAFAQDAPETSPPSDEVEGVVPQDAASNEENSQGDIVVTGTLISNPNLTASSPVAVVGEDELQLRQTNNVEQVLRELPGASANLGQNVNNGSVGSARVDLRSLGANRNIVLLDGVRITPSNFSGIVDLNNIPVALIQRVDVLTGGASTTYGADAVSGVVNFITQRDFAGMELDVSSQITERGDGHTFRADLTLGANFDDGRGNAVIGLGYQEADPVFFGDRDIAKFTVSSASGVASGDSATAVPTAFSLAGANGFQQINGSGTALVPQYNFFNFNPFNIFQTPFERFNIYGAAHYEVSDDVEVYTRALFSKNTVSTIIAASGIFGTNAQISLANPFLTPGIRQQFCDLADFNLTTPGRQGPTGPCTAANTTDLASALIYRRTTEVGPRTSEYATTIFDYQAGVRLNVTDNILLDVYGSYGESENEETRRNYVSFSRVLQALSATSTTTCTVTTNGCVPLNIFGQEGSITPEMAAFIGGVTSSITNRASLAQAHALLSGDFGYQLPWASEPIAFALGGEYRQYTAERRPDNLASVPGELGGAGGAVLPVNGGYDVYEGFGELIVPIASDRPFFDELTLEAGLRYSKYGVDAPTNPTFDATTYKLGINWAPHSMIRFRGNYQRAVRAPNIGELFAPVSTGLTNLLVDPCFGSSAPTLAGGAANPNFRSGLVAGQTLRAVCIAQGATAFQIDSTTGIPNPTAGQANATGGGNPLIRPEKATTYTLGVVLRPEEYLRGLSVSLDYYNIKVENAITAATPADILSACFNANFSPTSAECLGIRRNALTGGLSGTPTASNPVPGLPAPLTNNGLLKTDGIDLVVNYRRDLGFARLNWNFAGNYTMSSFFQASPTAFGRDCVGFYSTNCGISNGLSTGSITPKYSWNQRTTLSFGPVDVSLLWRHISKMRYEGQAADFAARGFTDNVGTPGQPGFVAGTRYLFPLNGIPTRTITGAGPLAGRTVDFNRIKAADYFDLTLRVNASDNMEFTFTVQNLLDREPPIVGSSAGSTTFNGGNTYPSTYDTIGRRFTAGARLRF